jgi:hypothetical protein
MDIKTNYLIIENSGNILFSSITLNLNRWSIIETDNVKIIGSTVFVGTFFYKIPEINVF